MQNLVRSTLSLTFVISAARVVFNIKSRMTRETTWQLELKGDLTKQRRVEAVDKLLSVLTLLVGTVFGLQAIGLDGAPHIGAIRRQHPHSQLWFTLWRSCKKQHLLFLCSLPVCGRPCFLFMGPFFFKLAARER